MSAPDGRSSVLASVRAEHLVAAIASDLVAARDQLNELDGIAGDGDLGVTASAAAAALAELAPALSGKNVADALAAIGMALARRAPSTGGTLIAFACLAAGRAAPIEPASATDLAASLLEAARDEVVRRGKVAPGDRTMLDAIDPAATALRTAADAGRSLSDALAAAAVAADGGARATAGMDAVTGRAGWLAERAKGHEDAGARLIAIVADAAAGAAKAARTTRRAIPES